MIRKSLILIAFFASVATAIAGQRYFSEVDKDGNVLRTITGSSVESVSKLCPTKNQWIETKTNDDKINFAGPGFKYDAVKKNFIAPKPTYNAVLDEKCQWIAVEESTVTK